MSELSNRDIDRLFQRGAERYDFEFDTGAWEQMQALLERHRRRRRAWWWFTAIALLLLIIGSIYMFRPFSDPAPLQTEPTTSPSETVPASPVGSPPQANREESPSLLPLPTLAPTIPEGPVEPVPAYQRPANPRALQAPADERSSRAIIEKAPPPLAGLSSNVETSARALSTAPFGVILPLPDSAELPTQLVFTDSSGLALIDPVRPKNRAFYLGFNVSREATSIGFSDFGNGAFKAGLTADFRSGKHFGLGAGLFYTRKDYQAGYGEYQPDQGFWTYGVAPDQTRGYCKMLELPVYASYYFRHYAASSLFIEAGLTNFIMLEEHYWYSYEDPNPNLISYWASEGEYHSWMSILQVSPGYQFRLGGPFGLQLAPFVQIPLGGVGHGNINLVSAGLNLRLLLRPTH